MIRILLVDDRNIMRQGLKALLDPRPNLEVVGIAEDGNTAIEQVAIHQPDIVLMDIEMPGMSGIIATAKICQQFPKTKVIVLSSHENTEYVIEALKAGAEGYLVKNSPIRCLEQAIIAVYRGHSQIESKLLKEVVAHSSYSSPVTPQPSKSASPNNHTLGKPMLKLDSDVALRSDNSKQVGKTAVKTASEQSTSKIVPVNRGIVAQKNEGVAHGLAVSSNSTMQKSQLQSQNTKFSQYLWWSIIGLGIFSCLSLAITALAYWRASKSSAVPALETPVVSEAISAIGYLEPQGEVIQLSAPAFAEGERVERLLVDRGDWVKKGQVVAVLDNRDRLQAALQQAQTEVATAQALLSRVEAGAKAEIRSQKTKFQEKEAELAEQIVTKTANLANLAAKLDNRSNIERATIARLQIKLRNAIKECQRYELLLADGAIAASQRDRICLQQETVRQQLQTARANLNTVSSNLQQQIKQAEVDLERSKTASANQTSQAQASLEVISQVRPVDLAVAQSELATAKAKVVKARAELDSASVESPVDGQILEINTQPGEIVHRDRGIVVMGDTQNMYVVAQVYETDINRIRIGQRATITRDGITQELGGTVEDIGWQIGTKDVLDNEPAADAKAIVKVRIRLNPQSSQEVANLTNMKVNTIIHTSQQIGNQSVN